MPGLTDGCPRFWNGHRFRQPRRVGLRTGLPACPLADPIGGWPEYVSHPHVRGFLTLVAIAGDLILLPVAGCISARRPSECEGIPLRLLPVSFLRGSPPCVLGAHPKTTKNGYVCHCWATTQLCFGDPSRTAADHDVALSARAPTVAHERPSFRNRPSRAWRNVLFRDSRVCAFGTPEDHEKTTAVRASERTAFAVRRNTKAFRSICGREPFLRDSLPCALGRTRRRRKAAACATVGQQPNSASAIRRAPRLTTTLHCRPERRQWHTKGRLFETAPSGQGTERTLDRCCHDHGLPPMTTLNRVPIPCRTPAHAVRAE